MHHSRSLDEWRILQTTRLGKPMILFGNWHEGLGEEISGTKNLMDQQLGQSTNCYAYAFGDIACITADALKVVAKYHSYCRSGLRGLNHGKNKHMALNADSMEPGMPLSYQQLPLEGGLDFHYAGGNLRLAEMTPAIE